MQWRSDRNVLRIVFFSLENLDSFFEQMPHRTNKNIKEFWNIFFPRWQSLYYTAQIASCERTINRKIKSRCTRPRRYTIYILHKFIYIIRSYMYSILHILLRLCALGSCFWFVYSIKDPNKSKTACRRPVAISPRSRLWQRIWWCPCCDSRTCIRIEDRTLVLWFWFCCRLVAESPHHNCWNDAKEARKLIMMSKNRCSSSNTHHLDGGTFSIIKYRPVSSVLLLSTELRLGQIHLHLLSSYDCACKNGWWFC